MQRRLGPFIKRPNCLGWSLLLLTPLPPLLLLPAPLPRLQLLLRVLLWLL